MKEHQSNLELKQEKAIMALLAEPSLRQAAKACGVGESTLYRWLQEEDFNNAFKHARKEAFSQSITRLQQATSTAVDTLKDIMENKESPASSRVSAAKTVIEIAYKAYGLENVTAKLEEMEKRFEMQEGS